MSKKATRDYCIGYRPWLGSEFLGTFVLAKADTFRWWLHGKQMIKCDRLEDAKKFTVFARLFGYSCTDDEGNFI